jgi:carbonic anhydrase
MPPASEEMRDILAGLDKFQREVFPHRRDLFDSLAASQRPEVLFITCADSRIDPNLLTQTQPGELFIVRNAGNMIPAYGSAAGGVTASIEYAVSALKVKELVICGHSDCGAMKGLLHPEKVASMKTVASWLHHGETARAVVEAMHGHKAEDIQLGHLIEQNVVAQMRNVLTHPCVAAAVSMNRLRLHGWVYDIGHGTVHVYDQPAERFVDSRTALAHVTPAAMHQGIHGPLV